MKYACYDSKDDCSDDCDTYHFLLDCHTNDHVHGHVRDHTSCHGRGGMDPVDVDDVVVLYEAKKITFMLM